MTTAAVTTIWANLVASTLADAGVRLVVVSPGSRSTPLVAALASEPRLELVTLVDERTAAFYALGAARATGDAVALVCTSGTAAAHYYPALIEASLSAIPLVAITADRPPELHACGASQTIDQRDLYGHFARASLDLGAPHATESALRSVRRTILHAVTLARGPHPGPVHVNAPFRKPLEPAAPSTDLERQLARVAAELASSAVLPPPRMVADAVAIDVVARAVASEPDGVIVVGAMPTAFAATREDVLALAVRAGYPIIAESGSQLRLVPHDGARIVRVDHFDLIPVDELPLPKVIVQLGAEPVSASWPGWLARTTAKRIVLAGNAWHDPEGTAQVVVGDVGDALARIVDTLERMPARATSTSTPWAALEQRAASAAEHAIDAHPRSETAVMRVAIAAMRTGLVQIGNSLPIRVVDHVGASNDVAVITQRGAAGIDGLIASAAGATRAGKPVLLVLGDVSFAHDLGGLLATRAAAAPLAVLVVDNRGGQIFAGLPIGRAEIGAAFGEHWLTPTGVDPAAVASALGIRAVTAASPQAVAAAIEGNDGVVVIHAPVSVSGAHDVRRTAIEMFRAGENSAREMKSS